MNMQQITDMRNGLQAILQSVASGVPVYTAEITSVINADGSNVNEFMTVFFTVGEETEEGENLDSESYRTSADLTVGYFNESAGKDQGILDSMADDIRQAVMEYPGSDIYRNGWEYVPSVENSTPGIYFRFTVEYSN